MQAPAGEAVWSRDGDRWIPAPAARGPWDPGQAHGGAPAGLLARAAEQAEGGEGLAVVRLAYDFLAAVPVAPAAVEARVLKGGRRFQLVEATLAGEDGRVVCRMRAIRLRRSGGGEEGGGPGPAPPPLELEGPAHAPLDAGAPGEDGFYPTVMEIRRSNGDVGSGRMAAWFRLRRPLVAGEEPSPVQRAVMAADFANGLSWILPFEDWIFVNTDLTVHLHRVPEGEWIGLDARTDTGADGAGVATATLFDRRGRVGVATQALFLERR